MRAAAHRPEKGRSGRCGRGSGPRPHPAACGGGSRRKLPRLSLLVPAFRPRAIYPRPVEAPGAVSSRGALDISLFVYSCRGDLKSRSADPTSTTSPKNITATLSEMLRSEEHTSELQSLMRTPYAVLGWKTQKQKRQQNH